ncbi:hypothetical protein [Plantactinospora sonchi]|uniref:Lipoprotein n=1 Tax=Plantactinospora sonchi TaxID=1544735 RepID=A0ABU7S2R8_9ACTN
MNLSVPRRRLAAALGAVAALLTAAGCDRSTEPVAPALDVGLTVTTARESDLLRIDYTLVNRTGADIVVFSGVPAEDTHDSPVVDPNAVYATARDDNTVELAKRVFAPPEGVGVAVDFVVRGAVLAPQASLGEVLRIPLPLTARRPYDSSARLPDRVGRAVFCVGVAHRDAVPPIPAASGDTDERASYPHRASVAREQQLVCGEPFPL